MQNIHNSMRIAASMKPSDETVGALLSFIDEEGEPECDFRRSLLKEQKEILQNRISKAFDKGNISLYEYDDDGNPLRVKDISDKIAAFAIATGFVDKRSNHNEIYALFQRNNNPAKGWLSNIRFVSADMLEDHLKKYRIGRIIFSSYAEANEFIVKLQDRILPGEEWSYKDAAPELLRKRTAFQILESYLKTVLEAIIADYKAGLSESEIAFSRDNKYMVFNTGLLDKYANDIRLVVEVKDKEKIILGAAKILKGGFSEADKYRFSSNTIQVPMHNFYIDPTSIIFRADLKLDIGDTDSLSHCIEDGIKRNRFPAMYTENVLAKDLPGVTSRFSAAIERAKKVAQRNYKYVVPQYWTTKDGNSIQFLMPIYLDGDYSKLPDFALVLSHETISATDGNATEYYKLRTILPLAWAYNNARVICKPDDSWLKPSIITDSAEIDDLDEVMDS